VFDSQGPYDFGICAGGLYHISNPKELLMDLRQKVKKALVIQTVYSLANEDEDYFETRPWLDLGLSF
jgi:2-polyprenyl-3-methyl-5-hydroxy-6-metoxy-1,4-benzoquinol methylase